MNGRASSWQSPRTLLMCPPQCPQAPRNSALLTSRVVSRAAVMGAHRGEDAPMAYRAMTPPPLLSLKTSGR